jgi:hypothetical protein
MLSLGSGFFNARGLADVNGEVLFGFGRVNVTAGVRMKATGVSVRQRVRHGGGVCRRKENRRSRPRFRPAEGTLEEAAEEAEQE